MTSQTRWNRLSDQQRLERAHSIAKTVDPWHWLEPDGSLPLEHPQLWPKVMRVAQAIEAGWDLPPGTARGTLLLCPKRPQRQPCPGQLRVTRRPDDQLLVFCPECGAEVTCIRNWQRTPWARPRCEPLPLGADQLGAVDLEELVLAMTEEVEDWAAYLDARTGQVVSVPHESLRQLEGEPPSLFADSQLAAANLELARALQADATGRYIPIEPLSGRQKFSIMESFAAGLPAGPAREQLDQALQARSPLRCFLQTVSADPTLRSHWLAYETRALHDHAQAWLEEVRDESAFD